MRSEADLYENQEYQSIISCNGKPSQFVARIVAISIVAVVVDPGERARGPVRNNVVAIETHFAIEKEKALIDFFR